MKQYTEPKNDIKLLSLGFVETIPSPRLGFFRGVFLANHFGKYWQLNQNNQYILT